MILLIDNYDSFTHNLSRYIQCLGFETIVYRNDAITIAQIKALAPKAIILSPGPCTPKQAGICLETISAFASSIPILGVCLGHQAIAEAMGYPVVRANKPMHGKASRIFHEGNPLFSGIPSPFLAGRYHSLIVDIRDTADIRITAGTDDGVVMAIEHKTYPLYGVQFHPESILTEHGDVILKNFLNIANDWNQSKRKAE